MEITFLKEVLERRFRWSASGDRKEVGFYTCTLMSRILNTHDMGSAAAVVKPG